MTKGNAGDMQKMITKVLSDLDAVNAAHDKRVEAERARRARLTPEARAAEDAAVASQRKAEERRNLTQKFQRMGEAVLKRETWTIEQFSWLLAAATPEGDSWSFFDGRSSKEEKEHKTYSAILQSCVGPLLKPVNPSEPSEKHRFAVQSLIETARHKRIGCFEVLAEMIQPHLKALPATPPSESSPVQVTKKSPRQAELAKIGLQTRERQKTQRRADLRTFVQAQVDSKDAIQEDDAIVFPIRGTELVEQFCEAYPRWKTMSLGTFERDRREMKPRIDVAPGRPPNKNK